MEFSEFGLHPDLLDGIDALNFKAATPIQEKAIPVILEGKDLIGVAQTGTGKTAAFVLPILNEILYGPAGHFTHALVIVPTRELAAQIDQMIGAYSYFTGISSIAIYGGGDGKEFAQEKSALVQGADVIVATPGRLIAHINLGYVDFSRLRFLVLDEADRMLDMGFQPDLLAIIKKINPQRQSLLFSATMPPQVLKLARTLLRDPVTVSIALSKPAEGVTQSVCFVDDKHKLALVTELLKDRAGQRVLIFSSTKAVVGQLYRQLAKRNLPVAPISSDLEQAEREQTMLDFRNRKTDILVATDVLSRGIDVEGIDLVINYDIPRDAEDYVHRIGRTARAERKGEAITFVSPVDQGRFRRIEKLIGKTIDRMPLPPHMSAGEEKTQQRPRHESRHHKKGGATVLHPGEKPKQGGEKKEEDNKKRRRRGGRNRGKKGGEKPTPPSVA